MAGIVCRSVGGAHQHNFFYILCNRPSPTCPITPWTSHKVTASIVTYFNVSKHPEQEKKNNSSSQTKGFSSFYFHFPPNFHLFIFPFPHPTPFCRSGYLSKKRNGAGLSTPLKIIIKKKKGEKKKWSGRVPVYMGLLLCRILKWFVDTIILKIRRTTSIPAVQRLRPTLSTELFFFSFFFFGAK